MHMHTHDTRRACGGCVFIEVRIGESIFMFHFISFFPVLCICAPSRHAPEHHPRMRQPRHCKVLTTACTHIACITCACPSHGFCARPVVGTRPAMLLDPQRDHRRRTASGMKPMYGLAWYVFLPLLFFSVASITDGTGRPRSADTRVNTLL